MYGRKNGGVKASERYVMEKAVSCINNASRGKKGLVSKFGLITFSKPAQ